VTTARARAVSDVAPPPPPPQVSLPPLFFLLLQREHWLINYSMTVIFCIVSSGSSVIQFHVLSLSGDPAARSRASIALFSAAIITHLFSYTIFAPELVRKRMCQVHGRGAAAAAPVLARDVAHPQDISINIHAGAVKTPVILFI
jgi:hypothetical protein